MSNVQQIQWKGPPTVRAKPVPPELWEKHKEELCSLYSKTSLDDLMTIMRIRHHFTPSRRQYISQIEKWGVQKYNKSGLDSSKSNIASVTHGDHNENKSRDSDQPSLRKPYPKRNAPNYRPEIPPKKRQKLSNFIAEKACDDLTVAISRLSSSNDREQALDPRNQNEDSSGQTFSTSHTQYSDLRPRENAPEQDFDNYISVSDSTNEPEKSEDLEVKSLVGLDLDEIEDLKVAADFLFASNCLMDAFGTYVLLLQKLKLPTTGPKKSENMIIDAIIGCGRCARTQSQIEITINTLNQKLSQRPIYAEDTAEEFTCRCLLEHLYRKQKNSAQADFQQQLAGRSTFVQQRCLPQPRQGRRALSFQIYFYLDRILSTAHFMSMNNLKNEIISLKPGLFEYESGRMRNDSIRSCLKWCLRELQARSIFTAPSIDVEYLNTDIHRVEFLAIFGDMWSAWKKDKARLPPDANRHEIDTGISPTEFFAAICSMIMAAASKLPFVDIGLMLGPLGPAFKNTKDIYPRALGGVESLLGGSDWHLANSFLKAYLELNKERPPAITPEQVAWGRFVSDKIKSFLRKQIRLKLPKTTEADQAELDVLKCIRSDAEKSSVCFTGIFETLSPSLHSATFSSLRALRDRLGQESEKFVEAPDFTLPSRIMRDGSMTSLLLSLGSLSELDTGASALETLATVSSHARDRLAEMI